MRIKRIIDCMLMNKWFYVIVTILFIFGFAYVFVWMRPCVIFDEKYVADNALLGTFGDFIGGVLGTIFAMISILVMIKTFESQRKVTIKNEEQLENQRLNDLFFELLRLYQSETQELCGSKDGDIVGNRVTVFNYNNKDFFDFEKETIQKNFHPVNSFEGNKEKALLSYMEFYVKHRTKVGACFRTLYSIYVLLDKANVKQEVKRSYLKILRAQLTESELFFIRYNAMTYYGIHFINFIVKYNILKHLPIFDLLEFKDWWKDLSPDQRIGINILFYNCSRILRTLLKNSGNQVKKSPDSKNRYCYVIEAIGGYKVEISFFINTNQENKEYEYSGFEKMAPKRIQQLLDCYLKEVFIYANFERLNKLSDLKFYSSPIEQKDNIIKINSCVQNLYKERLKIRYSETF